MGALSRRALLTRIKMIDDFQAKEGKKEQILQSLGIFQLWEDLDEVVI